MISTLPFQALLRCSAAHGIERDELCRSAGVDPQILRDPEGRVRISVYYTLLERLAQAVDDPHIGLEVPRHVQPDSYGLLGFLFMSSASVGQAFERMLRYQRLVADPAITMELRSGQAMVTYELWGPDRPAHAHIGDAFAAETVLGFQMLCGDAVLQGFELALTRPPTDPTPYLKLLGVCPDFSAPQLQLSFDAALLELPVHGADPALSDMLERQAKIMMRLLPPRSKDPASHGDRVREIVLELLPDGVPKIEQVARRMGKSSRSLQRHLRHERTSLKGIIDELRREISQEQLRRGVCSTEIALMLGFSEVSAFHRAFKRWTGSSPGKWQAPASEGLDRGQ